jgi:DNA-binding LacI/PurR family transcriptional regulator
MNGLKSPLATANDVARRAGVSQSAVSRAFTPGASVSSVTRTKVLEAAQELGYRPNAIARSLITRRSNMVGVAIGNLANPFFSAALEELSNQLGTAGLRLLLFSANLEAPIEEVLQYRLESLVMLSIPLTSKLAVECEAARVPVVLFNRTLPGSGVSSVTGDNGNGGRAIAAYLLASGHERVAFMAGLNESSTSREREEGFTRYLQEQGHSLYLREQGDFDGATAATAMRRLLLRPVRPDAVFCANDHMAIIALQVAQAEFGLEVGRDISIVGFDDVPQASSPGVSLTTYSQPIDPMVKATVDIIDRLGKGETEPRNVVVPGELMVRASTRKPRRSPQNGANNR